MSRKSERDADSNRDSKRQQFAIPAQPTPRPRRWWLAATVGVGFVAWVFYVLAGTASGPAVSGSPELQTTAFVPVHAAATGEIHLAKSDLADGRAKFFEYAAPTGARVRFLAVKDARGAYRTALDGCEVCYEARKGYVQQGEEMLCRKCGKSFPISMIGGAMGGCHPIGLPSSAADSDVVIKAVDLVRLDAERTAQGPRP